MDMKAKPFSAVLGAIAAAALLASCGTAIDKYAPLPEDDEQPDFGFLRDNDKNDPSSAGPLTWQTLENTDTHPEFRALMEQAFGIEQTEDGKHGCLYANADGAEAGNNTLLNALGNASVKKILTDKDIMSTLLNTLSQDYSDLARSDATAAVLNAYFDILPDDGSGNFGGSDSLTRGQAMTLIMRAVTPADGSGAPQPDPEFTAAVGDTVYTDYAAAVDSLCYVSTADGSLTEANFTETMTRAEYVYLMMNAIFGSDTVSAFDPYEVFMGDCIDGGEGDGAHSYILTTAMANAERGLPTSLYRALAMAVSLNVIDAETDWASPITKKDALFMFAKAAFKYDPGAAVSEVSPEDAEAQYKKEATASYKSHKSDTSLGKSDYIKKFVLLRTKGKSKKNTEKTLLERYPAE